jgi:hypothetical protein
MLTPTTVLMDPVQQHINNNIFPNKRANRNSMEAAGLEHELEVIFSLIDQSHMACYHSVDGAVESGDWAKRFEIDLVVILPLGRLILVEIKSYRGFLEREDKNTWSRTWDEEVLGGLKDPLRQLDRSAKLFREWIGRPKDEIALIPMIVYTNDPLFSPEIMEEMKRYSRIVSCTGYGFVQALKEKLVPRLVEQAGAGIDEKSLSMIRFMLKMGFSPVVYDDEWIFGSRKQDAS